MVSVPDLQDGNEFKRKRERVSNGEFATWVGELTSKPVSLYKVYVTCTEPEFETWLDEARSLPCEDIFLVGGDSSTKSYGEGVTGDRRGSEHRATQGLSLWGHHHPHPTQDSSPLDPPPTMRPTG